MGTPGKGTATRQPGHQQTTIHFQVLRTPVVHFNNRCSAPVPGPRELPLRSCSSLSLLFCCVQPTSHFRPPSPGFCESTLVPPACSAFSSLRHRVWYESRSFPLFFPTRYPVQQKGRQSRPFSSRAFLCVQLGRSSSPVDYPRDVPRLSQGLRNRSFSVFDRLPFIRQTLDQKARQSIETNVVSPKISLFYPLPLTIDPQETFLSLAFPRSNQLIVCSHSQK